MKDFIIDITFYAVMAMGVWFVFDPDGAADFIIALGRALYPLLPG